MEVLAVANMGHQASISRHIATHWTNSRHWHIHTGMHEVGISSSFEVAASRDSHARTRLLPWRDLATASNTLKVHPLILQLKRRLQASLNGATRSHGAIWIIKTLRRLHVYEGCNGAGIRLRIVHDTSHVTNLVDDSPLGFASKSASHEVSATWGQRC